MSDLSEHFSDDRFLFFSYCYSVFDRPLTYSVMFFSHSVLLCQLTDYLWIAIILIADNTAGGLRKARSWNMFV